MPNNEIQSSEEPPISQADLLQVCIALNYAQALLQKEPTDKEVRAKITQLKKLIYKAAKRYDGLAQVDNWLRKNDPTNSTTGSIEGVNWDFLPENLRPHTEM